MPLIKAFSLTVTAAAQRLSDVYGDGAGVVNAVNDIPYRQILLSMDTADAEIGDSTVTTTAYGVKVQFAATLPIPLGPFPTGPIKLSEFWVIGTSGKLHILGLPY